MSELPKETQLHLFDDKLFIIRRLLPNVIQVNFERDTGFDDVLFCPLSDSYEAAIIHFPTRDDFPPEDIVA